MRLTPGTQAWVRKNIMQPWCHGVSSRGSATSIQKQVKDGIACIIFYDAGEGAIGASYVDERSGTVTAGFFERQYIWLRME